MRIKEIAAKFARLEASPRFSALSRMSDADLDRRIVLGLNDMAADWPSFGAMVSGLRESPMPADTDLAGQIEVFITDWQAQQRGKVVQSRGRRPCELATVGRAGRSGRPQRRAVPHRPRADG